MNKKSIEIFTHDQATRKNIPTAEYQSIMDKEAQNPIRLAYERRNRDLDPQLVWRGKDEQDWSDLVLQAMPLYIQEKVHPKVLIDDLRRRSQKNDDDKELPDLFADFNGVPDTNAKTEFYQHDANWSNRMILGDSLQVMASLAEREGLRGKVQCIYIDPPYGIKFNSNFQWSTTSRDVKDGNAEHITREPEQVKAFRDTWRDGIHSYLTYLRDRLTVARDLLTESGSIFVQIGVENVHRVRALMDEVFGDDNIVSQITIKRSSIMFQSKYLNNATFYILWFAKNIKEIKYHKLYIERSIEDFVNNAGSHTWIENKDSIIAIKLSSEKRNNLDAIGYSETNIIFVTLSINAQGTEKREPFSYQGQKYLPPLNSQWKSSYVGLERLKKANRLIAEGRTVRYRQYYYDYPSTVLHSFWERIGAASEKIYVVQTPNEIIKKCILMTTDPGDLVLDPTCGSGTTAYVAEQWGRRWITIDTSRVALALARARLMGARYHYYLLADSPEGQLKEAEVSRIAPSESPTYRNLRQGFVYDRVPHITLESIANNAEIDVIWEKYQKTLEPLREKLNQALNKKWEDWEIPREAENDWNAEAIELHKKWWERRIARQKEIDASIAAKAEYEYLYDKPYDDSKKVRVAGPFTVESLSPHRVMTIGENDDLIDPLKGSKKEDSDESGFVNMILENLKTAGVQQAHKEDKIDFISITPWPGHFVCAEGHYIEGDEATGNERRAAIFLGPEFGTVSRPDLVAAAREAGDADFDVLIACAFNYDAHSSEFDKLGRIPILKARMNADLHMAEDLKNTGKGNLFVIFGEPDIDIIEAGNEQIQVKINGVDVFHPNSGEVRSDGAEGIACWFIDTDYNEESFFVRQAYFLGANDPYKTLKTTLKAEIDAEAWATLNSDISRPFNKPESGRIAIKVINHLGDEVMKVYRVG